jgi:hypothetical protein
MVEETIKQTGERKDVRSQSLAPTARARVEQAEIDNGRRPGLTTDER